MSKKRKAKETILPVQSRRTENTIIASITTPTAPLSAFAAARAKAKIATSDRVDHEAEDGSAESAEKSKSKKLKIAKSSTSRTPARRKGKDNKLVQEDAIDTENVFSQLASSSRHAMPEPYKLPIQDQDYDSDDPSDEGRETDVVLSETLNDERIVQMSSWSPMKENYVSDNPETERISMNNGETLSILGQYRLRVQEGVIIVAGAFLAAGAPALEVYAPSTSSIPVIKCIKFEGAVLEISSIRPGENAIEILERLSPLYSSGTSAIWGRVTDSEQSFFKVCDCLEMKLHPQLRNPRFLTHSQYRKPAVFYLWMFLRHGRSV